MSNGAAQCILCDQTNEVQLGGVPGKDMAACECPACGSYTFSPEVKSLLLTDNFKSKRYLISAVTRRASDREAQLALISAKVEELIAAAPAPKTPYDVLDPLLLAIQDALLDPLGHVAIPYNDYPLFCLQGPGQLKSYLQLLKNLGLIDYGADSPNRKFTADLTLRGWGRVGELRKTGRSSNRAFVAMSFAEELNAAFDQGIVPGLADAGWLAHRVDRDPHNERIDDKIIADIRRSGMVVADFTGNRQGVYFEAGFGLGLGLPVVWTVRESDLAAVHFDTRQYNHVVWKDPAELRLKLRDRLLATIPAPLPAPTTVE